MKCTIAINFFKINILLLASILLVNCSSENPIKENMPIVDNKGSLIFMSVDTSEITIGADISNYDYNYIVDWGDGIIDTNITDSTVHKYTKKGTYIIKIRGEYPRLNDANTCRQMTSLEQWGSIEWKDMSNMFRRCPNLIINATDIPNLKSVKNMSGLFSPLFEFNQNISNWDVSSVENMSYMFENATNFNQDISNWNVSNVKDMGSMFAHAKSFNHPIGKWNTSNVKDMGRMFWGSDKFDQDLSHWDISSVEYKERWIFSPGHARFFGLDEMFSGVTLSTANYDALLQSWSNQSVHNNMQFNGGYNSKYSQSSKEARSRLINEYNWTIIDGGEE